MTFWIIISFLLVALVPLLVWYAWNVRRRILFENLKLQLYLIRVPLVQKEGRDLKADINLSEQLFGALASLKRPFVFEVAVPHVGEDICFYIAVPRAHGGTAARQIQGLFPDAQVEEAPDYNVFNPHGVAQGAYVTQKYNYALPIRTYQDIGSETFASILSGLSKINVAGEGAAIQVVLLPAHAEAKKAVSSALKRLKGGEPLEKIQKGGAGGVSSALKEAFPGKKKEAEGPRIVDEQAVRALEAKLSKPLFVVNVRLLASAPSQYQADAILDSIASAFTQFSAPNRNELRAVTPRNLEKLIYQYSFREFDASQAMTLTSEEVASVFHLPTPFLEVPKIKWLKAKEAAPPTALPESGVPIGESVFRGERKTIRVTDEDRRRHVYVVGQTGTGKSVLLSNMLADDIERGRGAAIIDPHGDLVESVMRLIPESRHDDVIVFDPGDLMRPLGLNMLDIDPARPEEKTFVVNEMQGIFNKLFPPETMGPMFEQYMRNALLLLMEDKAEPATLMEVPRVFTDSAFRARKLARITNPAVVDFWEKEAAKAGGEASLANITPYITSKFSNFIANDYIRPIISQPKSAFRFREVMDEGKILLVNLSKGRIGDINANLLGMIIVGKILMAALSRVDIADQEKRRDFNLYIDEFQNFTTDSISVILSEARKYRLNLVIAHQFIAQLTEKIRDAVFGNVGSMVAFRVGVQDAEFLEKQFTPVFSKQDLINIDNFNAYAKILMNGMTSAPFNIRTLPPLFGNPGRIARIKELSRARYGRDRREVEEEALKRIRE